MDQAAPEIGDNVVSQARRVKRVQPVNVDQLARRELLGNLGHRVKRARRAVLMTLNVIYAKFLSKLSHRECLHIFYERITLVE